MESYDINRRTTTTGDVRRITEVQIRRQESERNPPGLNDPPDAGQQRVGEEIQVGEDDKKWDLEGVREITRLRRVEERIYDEACRDRHWPRGGKTWMKTTNNGRNGVESGGCESTEH